MSCTPSVAFIFQSQILLPGGWQPFPSQASHTKQVSLIIHYLSIWDRNLVSKILLVRSLSEICPRKRSPCRVRSIRICLTISPRYIPLVIFSYLFGEEGITLMRTEKWFLRTQVWVWRACHMVQSGLGELFLELSDTYYRENRVK